MARTPKTPSSPEAAKPSRTKAKPQAAAPKAKAAPPAAAPKPAAAKTPTRATAKPAPTKATARAAAKPAPAKAPARAAAKSAPAKSPARTAAKPAPAKAPALPAEPVAASARKTTRISPAARARAGLSAGNAQVKPRASSISPADSHVAEAIAAAEPKRPRGRKRAAPISPDRLELLVTAARKSLEDDKAEDIKVLDVTGRASFTDRIIIATGLADRQIQAMATHLEEALAKEGLKLKRNAIEASADWVLIDCGDMVIHLFKPEARETFRLEKMWGDDSPKADSGSGYEPA